MHKFINTPQQSTLNLPKFVIDNKLTAAAHNEENLWYIKCKLIYLIKYYIFYIL